MKKIVEGILKGFGMMEIATAKGIKFFLYSMIAVLMTVPVAYAHTVNGVTDGFGSNVIHACVRTSNSGRSKIFVGATGSCSNHYTAQHWSITGATGAAGTDGTNGVDGTNGTNGADGATGATGATGAAGATGATGATGAAGTNGTNGAAGATGATGATGAAGTNGTNGVSGYEIISGSTVSDASTDPKILTLLCSVSTKRVLGGGARVVVSNTADQKKILLYSSLPTVGATDGWSAEAVETAGVTNPWSIEGFVICATAAP